MKSHLTKEMKAVLAVREGRVGAFPNVLKALRKVEYWMRIGIKHNIPCDPVLLAEVQEKLARVETLIRAIR